MRTFYGAHFMMMALAIWLSSLSLSAAIFFPQSPGELIADINTANGNCQDDVIYLGGLSFPLTGPYLATVNGLPVIGPDNCGNDDDTGYGNSLLIQGGTITRPGSTGSYRFFEVGSGAFFSLDSVTLSNGNPGAGNLGGAILVDVDGELVSVNNSIFIGNTGVSGGAIAIVEGAGGTISYSTFTGNTSTGTLAGTGGGAIVIIGGVAKHLNTEASIGPLNGPCTYNKITASTLNNNSAANMGGAIAVFGDNCGIEAVTDSTLYGNTAGVDGGGIALDSSGGGLVTLGNSTITNNTATTAGGGISVETGSFLGNLVSTIVALNTATTGPDINTTGTIEQESFNLVGNSTGSGLTAGNPNAHGSFIGSSTNPINPNLGPLQNNGGPTLTMALLNGSLAIDNGANPLLLNWDQRGPDYFRTDGTDIGAYQTQPQPHEDDEGEDVIVDCDDEEFYEDDGYDDFEDDGGPIGPPLPIFPPAFDPYLGGGMGGPMGGIGGDVPMANGQMAGVETIAVAKGGPAPSMKEASEAPSATTTVSSVAKKPVKATPKITEEASDQEYEESGSGCSLVGGKGQAANNIGLMAVLLLGAARVTFRKKAAIRIK